MLMRAQMSESSLVECGPSDRHRRVAERFGELIAGTTDWGVSTPVSGWSAHDVVAHLIGWFPEFLAAGGVSLPTGPSLATDLSGAWSAQVAAIQNLLDDAASSESSFSHPMAGTHVLADAIDLFYTADVFMHTWDLARATGGDDRLDSEFSAHLLSGMEGIEDVLRSSGQYGPAVPVADDADVVARLVGFIGRDPQWRPH